MTPNDSLILRSKKKFSFDLLIDELHYFFFPYPLVSEKKVSFDLLINQLYDFYFLYPKGQYVIYLVAFIISIIYAIVNNFILVRPEERIVYESILLASFLVISFTILRAIMNISSPPLVNLDSEELKIKLNEAEKKILDSEELKIKLKAKEFLTPHEGLVLVLHLEGYTYKEIADKLNEDVRLIRAELNTVRTKVFSRLKRKAERA